jgi:glycosyltransferase involved in cell wall biosynthesis
LVIAAVEALKTEGYPVELVLIEGAPHREARVKYESLDILIDQLFAGWYGGVAVELMALGKPVLVYIRPEDLAFIPDSMQADLPFVQVEPDTLLEALRGVVQMPRPDLNALGRRSRAFVERWHDPKTVAVEMRESYEAALRRRSKLPR